MPEPVPFSKLARVNPPLTTQLPEPEASVSFIPMSDVTDSGEWNIQQSRCLRGIGPGYTPFQEDDVLFAKITPCMENGKGCHARGLLGGVGFGSTEFHVLRARGDAVPRFIYHWSQFEPLRRKAETAMTGSAGQQRVEAGFFDRFQVPELPPVEQSRIAEILDTVDWAIRETEAVVAKLRQVKAGLLHDLLTRGLDAHGHLRDPARHPEQFQDSPLGQIPRAWAIQSLDVMVEPSSPITYGVVKPGPEDRNGVLFVRGGDFPDGRIRLGCLRTITRAVSDHYRRTLLRGGELLVSLVGQPGACAVVPVELAGANIARQAALIRLRRDFNPHYVRAYLASRTCQRTLLGETLGSVQSVINLERLRTVQIPSPPRSEQDALVRTLATFDYRLASESDQLSKLHSLKRGLAHDLLTGRVRVKTGGAA